MAARLGGGRYGAAPLEPKRLYDRPVHPERHAVLFFHDDRAVGCAVHRQGQDVATLSVDYRRRSRIRLFDPRNGTISHYRAANRPSSHRFGNQTLRGYPGSFAKGLAAAAVAVVLLIPWASYVQNIEGSYDLSSSEVKARYIWDQIAILEAQYSGISYHDPEAKQVAQHAALAAGYGEKWLEMSEPEQYRAILREGYRNQPLSYPALSIAEAYARSIFQFLTAGGSGRWHYLILESPGQLTTLWFKTEQTNVLGMVREYFRSGSGLAFFASGVCIAFVPIARALGLVGIAAIATDKQWWSLLVVILPSRTSRLYICLSGIRDIGFRLNRR